MRVSRRHVLGVVGTAGSVGLAGCRLLGADRPPPLAPHGSHDRPTTADWPAFHHDGVNSGAIARGGIPLEEPPAVAWRQPVNGVVGSSRYPVVADELVIFPDWDPAPSTSRDADRVLRAFDAATGIEQWTVTFDSPPEGRAYLTPPTVTADSHIVVGVIDRQTGREAGALRAYTMEGDLVWETEGVGRGTPTYDGEDDALYAAMADERLVRVDATTGTIEWTRKLFDRIGPMAVSSCLYVVAEGGKVYALDPRDGSVGWQTNLDSYTIRAPPTVHSYVYLIGEHGTLYALNNESGEIKWRLGLDTPSSVTIGAYHPLITVGAYHAYIISPGRPGGDHSTRLNAVDPHNGQQRWTYTLQDVTGMPTPIVVGDWEDNPSSPVNVYLPVRDGVVALRPKIDFPFSRERWHWQADAIDSTDHIRGLAAADGRLFIVIKRKTVDMDPLPELVALE